MLKNVLKTKNYLSATQKNFYVQQRKVRWKKHTERHPWEELEKWKVKAKTIPRLSETPPNVPVFVHDKILEKNIADMESWRAQGIIPGQDLLKEDPSIQEYLDWVKRTDIKAGDWTPNSRRCGLIGVKIGMFPVWNEFYERLTVTCIWIPSNHVVQQKTMERDGYTAIQVGALDRKLKKTTKPMLGHFQKAGVSPKHRLREFKITPDCMLPIGHQLDVRHFMVGQYVDTISISKGKGYQGAMKRHGFSGGPASHGSSKFHRGVGSVGQQGQRMWKGKKMPGRMGGNKVRKLNNWLYMIDFKNNCVFVVGNVPGAKGDYVYLEDALRRRKKMLGNPPPFPTFYPPEDENLDLLTTKEQFILTAKSNRPDSWDGYGEKADAIPNDTQEILDYVNKYHESSLIITPPPLKPK